MEPKSRLAESADVARLRYHLVAQGCRMRGVTFNSIARRLRISRSMVTMTAKGQRVSRRVQMALARASGLPFKEIWG